MSLTVKGFASRGLVAGAAGGLAAGLFIRFVTERQIDVALRFEDAASLGGPSGGPAAVSRSTQQWGGVAAAVLYGAVLGVALAVAVAALHHRVRARSEFDRVAKLAAAAFVAVVLVPGLKYPPNPPAVGDPDTIGERTRLYLSLMGTSVLIVFAAWVLWEHLTERGVLGAPRAMAVGAAFTLVVALAFVLWPPSPDTVAPPDNEAAPALRIADDAPAPVLDAMLDTARSTRDDWIRDPGDPSEPLDLHAVEDRSDLAGAPGAVSTGELVPHSFTTAVWHFRLLTLAGLALMVSVMAAVLGLLLDLPNRAGLRAGAADPGVVGGAGAAPRA